MSAAAVLPIASPDSVWLHDGERLAWQRAVLHDADLPSGAKLFAWELFTHCLKFPRWRSTVESMGKAVGLKRSQAFVSFRELCKRGFAKQLSGGYLAIVPVSLRQLEESGNPDGGVRKSGLSEPRYKEVKQENLQETATTAAESVPVKPAVAAFSWKAKPAGNSQAPEPIPLPEPIARELMEYGVERKTAVSLAKDYPSEQIKLAIAYYRQRARDVSNPPGFIRSAIRDEWPLHGVLPAEPEPRMACWDGGWVYAKDVIPEDTVGDR